MPKVSPEQKKTTQGVDDLIDLLDTSSTPPSSGTTQNPAHAAPMSAFEQEYQESNFLKNLKQPAKPAGVASHGIDAMFQQVAQPNTLPLY